MVPFGPEFYIKNKFMLSQLEKYLNNSVYQTIWVAYSGGLDSTVLLHLTKCYLDKSNNHISLNAIHINHQLSKNAADWEKHTKSICDTLNVPLIIKRINKKPKPKDSIEAWARKQRYKIFLEICDNKNTAILLGHQKNDQAETFILNAIRGSGLQGLSGIPVTRKLGNLDIIRPFLNIEREQLLSYAQNKNLKWIEDESNQFDIFDRNFLRNKIIPELQQRWPRVNYTLARTASFCSESQYLLQEYLDNDLQALQVNQFNIYKLDGLKLEKLNPTKRKLIVKRWLEKTYQINLASQELELLNKHICSSDSGWEYQLKALFIIRKYHNQLSIDKVNTNENLEKHFFYHWKKQTKQLRIKELNINLTKEKLLAFGINEILLDSGKLTLRSRQGKDTCKPIGRKKSNKLKIIFQEMSIPPWDRQSIIIICLKDKPEKIVAVWPYFQCELK